ncbi:MAG: glycogen synthase [Gammaproteobacteria bacterium]|nr:glycogen synthase [Gammaproteobacteria bacterium]
MTNVLMVAAENDALPVVTISGREINGKVGGIGDVIRDVPRALAARGCHVVVVTPAYGAFANSPGCTLRTQVDVIFSGTTERVDLCEVPGREEVDNVRHFVLDHPQFATCGAGRIYCDDPPQRPFATDATKFALFCTAVAECVVGNSFGDLDVIHLHDWHAAFLLILRRYRPAYRKLKAVRCVYTIHNLSVQGVRPFAGDDSSLKSWFPGLRYDAKRLRDPRWPDCINPAAVAIRLADAVHTVSPSYAEEILQPSAVARCGFYGGEGLETELRAAQRQDRLLGILNGCEYPPPAQVGEPEWVDLLTLMRGSILRWAGNDTHLASAHFLAHLRLAALKNKRPAILVTGVGRITAQKLGLLRQPVRDGRSALENILDMLGDKGIFLLLGSGDPDYEQFITATAARYTNLIFLNGYSDPLAHTLYAHGDLFLMPSSFEPCGISQMLAMRAGQPCLVHAVGGLKDTVEDGVTGFSFSGDSLTEQAELLVDTFKRALTMYRKRPAQWRSMRQQASTMRFNWDITAADYLHRLYERPGG